MAKHKVTLAPNWEGGDKKGASHRRVMRDAEGEILKDRRGNEKVIEFRKGQVVELTDAELACCQKSIDRGALVLCDAAGKPTAPEWQKPDDTGVRRGQRRYEGAPDLGENTALDETAELERA